MTPETKYALIGDDRIAYQILGEGPLDVLISHGTFSSIDAIWAMAETSAPYLRLASVCRLILYDRLGTGWSDAVPLGALPPFESRWGEIRAVLDAVDSRRAVIIGVQDGGPPAMFGAATSPELVAGLVLFHSPARFRQSEDYPIGFDEATVQQWRTMMSSWDIDSMIQMSFPSRTPNDEFLQWGRKHMRSLATPGAMLAYVEEMLNTDVTDLLPAISVPTLVLHRRDYRWSPAELDRYVAEQIPGARYVEVPGGDAGLYFEHSAPMIEAITGFLGEIDPRTRDRRATERMMATILFTDIVASTEQAQQSGDNEWVHQLDLHDSVSRQLIARHGGRVVKTTGDGVLAMFDGPGRGLRAAEDLSASLARLGLTVRAGLHTGEVELRGDDVAGMGVHIASRVMSEAGPSEIMVSRTVKDLVVGSDLKFEARGSHHLKGVEGDWDLYSLAAG